MGNLAERSFLGGRGSGDLGAGVFFGAGIPWVGRVRWNCEILVVVWLGYVVWCFGGEGCVIRSRRPMYAF